MWSKVTDLLGRHIDFTVVFVSKPLSQLIGFVFKQIPQWAITCLKVHEATANEEAHVRYC